MKKLVIFLGVVAAAAVAERLLHKVELTLVTQKVVKNADADASGADAEPGSTRAAGVRYGFRSPSGLDILSRFDERIKNLIDRHPHDTV